MAADTARTMSVEKSEGECTIERIFNAQKKAYAGDPYPSYAQRVENLDKLQTLIKDNEDRFIDAVNADYGCRARYETIIGEILFMYGAIKVAKKNLRSWMRVRRVPTPLHMAPAKSRIEPQPLGVVGIISPWNYPVQLALTPAIAALAAGNRVMIKPSELTPHTSEAMRIAISENFAEETLAAITGGVETGQAFAETPFDHLLFTGSTAIGYRIAQAAAKNLTPVTLELGGKSPAIIDDSADIAHAAQSIAHGKSFNAGQTCVAPDYVLAPRGKLEEITREIGAAAKRYFPAINETDDYSSIISDRHFARLRAIIDDARARGVEIIEIGDRDALGAQRKIPLTLLVDPPHDCAAMDEEIFGPILPIIGIETSEEAIAFVNERDRPLALYWYGSNGQVRDRVLQKTVSGGVTVNDAMWHVAQENLPFGGVGKSGIGVYHGIAGFETFSHMKPIFYQSRFAGGGALRPPYTKQTDKFLAIIRKII